MKKVYVKVYVTEEIYKAFKECIKPMKVGPALDIFMDMAVRTDGSVFQKKLETIVEGILEARKT